MTEVHQQKKYQLEDRCLKFTLSVRDLVKTLPTTLTNREYAKQLVRSSASVGANYIEANEKLGKKDFLLHARIAKKEAKETRYWLDLIEPTKSSIEEHRRLRQESQELMHILGAIIEKMK